MSLKKSDVAIMALCTGLIVANIYYCQPLIILIAKHFNIEESVAGRITYITQAGYAAGLLFLVPLGDRLERKKQILGTTVLAILSLIIAAKAPTFLVLEIACFLIGFSSVVPQLILPLAAHLANPAQRGKTIGTIMSGLLLGILLSRTISGFIGKLYGWTSMFWIAAVLCVGLFVLMLLRFPKNEPKFSGSYAELMRSLLTLIKEQPVLREASAINALSFATFGAFWTTMVLLLGGEPFHFDSGTIGLFGLAGAAGALAAPIIGRMGDKRSPRVAIGFGLIVLFISFFVLYFGGSSVVGIILGIILLDFGLQGVHVSNQTRVYALIPEARNRLNTVFMTISFIGTACGSAFGLWLWKTGGWPAVCIGCAALAGGGIAIYSLTYKKK
ncbi:MFS transporter [Taibaiella soli]|uniref:MFS transporter n=1 Tax=Taibaiella soli TaxID=1649169 RepID=A0A2W2BED1_9BACT|nr:MFS transporter [Taibaiella soli]PZF74247.1 MFS transporter [Taibaiella soli]